VSYKAFNTLSVKLTDPTEAVPPVDVINVTVISSSPADVMDPALLSTNVDPSAKEIFPSELTTAPLATNSSTDEAFKVSVNVDPESTVSPSAPKLS
jgi:hypothetical protein